MTTRAEKDGDRLRPQRREEVEHRRRGRLYNTIFAVTEPGRGARGISAFVVDEEGTPGYRVGKHEDKMGIRCVPVVEIHLENCRCRRTNLLGRQRAAASSTR